MTNLPNVQKTGQIQGSQIDSFISAEITGSGGSQDTPHGLGHIPNTVLGFVTQKDITTAFDLILGVADATNCTFTLEATAKYRIYAF